MNRLLKLGLAALAATILAFPVFALAQMAIDPANADAVVTYSHSQHPGLACAMCHAETPTMPAPERVLHLTTVPEACFNCHGIGSNGEIPTDGCANCHNDVSPK